MAGEGAAWPPYRGAVALTDWARANWAELENEPGRPNPDGSLMQVPARRLFSFLYACLLRRLSYAKPEDAKRIRDLMWQDSAHVFAIVDSEGVTHPDGGRYVPEVPDIPAPDWWDDDHDPWKETWAIG